MKKALIILFGLFFLFILPATVMAQISEDSMQNASEDSMQDSSQESVGASSEQSSEDSSQQSSEESSQASSENSFRNSSNWSTNESGESSQYSAENSSEVALIIAGAAVGIGITVGVIITVFVSDAEQDEIVGLQDQIYLAEGSDYQQILTYFEISEKELVRIHDQLIAEGYVIESDQDAADYLSSLILRVSELSPDFGGQAAVI